MKKIYLFSEIDDDIKNSIGKEACKIIEEYPDSLGFVLTGEACEEFFKTREIEKELRTQITDLLNELCTKNGVCLNENVIISVVGSTPVNMPDIIEKIDVVWLPDDLEKMSMDDKTKRKLLSYLKFIKKYAYNVTQLILRPFNNLEVDFCEKYGAVGTDDLSIELLIELCKLFKQEYKKQSYIDFPCEQEKLFFDVLTAAFRSWDNPRACVYRRINELTNIKGLSVLVQLIDSNTGMPLTFEEQEIEDDFEDDLIDDEEGELEYGSISLDSISSWNDVKSLKYKQQQDEIKRINDERKKDIEYIVDLLRHPERFSNPNDRYIEESCLYLEKYIKEAETLFIEGKQVASAKLISELIGAKLHKTGWAYKENIKYFSEFLSNLFHELEEDSIEDIDRVIVPAVNIACYMWKKYDVTDVFEACNYLWLNLGKECYGDHLWLSRMCDNGDCEISCFDDIAEFNFGHDLDRYNMGSDCQLF